MMTDLPANVCAVVDRHGKTRYRFRRRGWKSGYLPGHPGTAEFHLAYAELLQSGTVAAKVSRKVTPGSLDDLYRLMKLSVDWRNKAANTQLQQSRVYDRFFDSLDRRGRRIGERPVEAVTVGWLQRVLGEMADRPGAANDLRKKLAVLLEYACALEWRQSNPVRHIKPFDTGDGFHPWSEDEIAAYRATHGLGTMARLTMELALNTGARLSNVARLTRDNLQGGRIMVAHVKGSNATSVPMLASTKAALDALPAAPIKFLVVTQFGKPFSVDGLGNRFRKWCDEAGLEHCSIHGLRKAIARRMAEAGATDSEGQAVTGHKKPAVFAGYRASANRAILADRALSNVATRFDDGIVQPTEGD